MSTRYPGVLTNYNPGTYYQSLTVQSNLTITNPPPPSRPVKRFTTSGWSLYQYNKQIGVYSKVYVCYIREFIVSRVHYSEVQLYIYICSCVIVII